MKPSRIRVLDLPFTAVEWVLPEELSPAQYLGQDKWMVWERSPLARERSLFGYWDDADDGQLAAAAQGAHGEDNGHHSGSGNFLHKGSLMWLIQVSTELLQSRSWIRTHALNPNPTSRLCMV